MLAEPAFLESVADEVARKIIDHRQQWDYIEFADTEQDSPALAQLFGCLVGHGLIPDRQTACICPCIALPSSFDDYLMGLSKTWRRSFRRAWKNLTQAGQTRFIVLKNATEIAESYPGAVRLHRARFEQKHEKSTFLSPVKQAFHAGIQARMAPYEWVRLYVLSVDRKPVAFYYGFAVGRNFQALQCGFDPTYAKFSVGLLMVGLAIEESIRCGHQIFDFGRGEQPFKLHWSDHLRETITIRLFDSRSLSLLARAILQGKRMIGRCKGCVLQGLAAIEAKARSGRISRTAQTSEDGNA
jgi:CelD/BcsL family acetyltransferase involved in cellulose biosynthesis